MSRLSLIIISLLCVLTLTVRAQYYSVNYDKETVAAMAAAYATGAVAEGYYNEQVQDILKHYEAAGVASAGIYASKYLERKAMTDLGIWCSATENHYYRRIRTMVADRILPKIWTVAGLLLKSPENALYWGPYLVKVCDDVKTLCYQFESVVTNSTLSFSDVQFWQVSEDIAAIMRLSEIGGIDFRQLLDDLAAVPASFTKASLTSDIENLYQMGVGLASAGASNISGALLQTSSFHSLFSGKISSAIDIIESYQGLWESLDAGIGDTLLGMLGTTSNVSGLFSLSEYDLTSWMTDYLTGASGQYYTQRWYIYRTDSGTETITSYTPPTEDSDILSGDHWYRISTSDSGYYPTSDELEAILQNSESHAGYSRDWVNEMNEKNDGYTYSISYTLMSYVIKKGGTQTKKAYAYSITVTRSYSNEVVVYEDVFDSYSMDLATFQAQLGALLSEYNDNEDGYTYYISSDTKNYYQATDEAKLAGVDAVTISVTCSDGVTIGQGSTQYKCSTCGSSLGAHTKECSMMTTVTDDGDTDLSELEEKLSEANAMIASIESSIASLEERNAELTTLILESGSLLASSYRAEYSSNLSLIEDYESQLQEWQALAEEYQEALDEAASDDEETDDYYRIPAIMADCETAFDLSWQGEGSWDGYTYTRKATMPNIDGVITFSATISIARKPKYFMGIKIHRAIVQISWELTSEYTSTSIVDVLTFSGTEDEKEKAEEVNSRLSEIAKEYAGCQVTAEYAQSDSLDTAAGDDVQHLLWSSDRLEIAREVDSRLTKIFADLVIMEKMLYYRHSIIDVLKDVAPYVNDEKGRRKTIVEECLDRWRTNGRNYNDSNTASDETD